MNMSKWKFNTKPLEIANVNTQHRKIVTRLPTPGSLETLEALGRYESRSMHGQLPVIWDRAEGFQVFDAYGNCWIDFTSTIFVTNTGHSNSKIIDALKKQLDKSLLHTYTFAHEVRLKFLKKLIEITPEFCEKAFLLSSGTEATECAIKLMRMRGQTIRPQKVGVVSFQGSMHGRTMGAEMLKGVPESSRWIGYHDPHIYHLPFPYPWSIKQEEGRQYDWHQHFQNDIKTLQQEKKIDFDNICGFMIESYQGWGAILYPKEYIKAIADFAKKHNCLITFDEIQGGFGRSGKLFVYEHYGIEPDLLCLGKGIGGGLPLSAVVGRRAVLDLPEIGSMSSTHSANPLCCAAALANMEEIESRNLVEESARKGEILSAYLNKLRGKYPERISYILGRGLLAAIIIINPENRKPDGVLASTICEKAMQKGLLLVHTGRESIKIGPPLVISDEALIEGLNVLDESISEALNG